MATQGNFKTEAIKPEIKSIHAFSASDLLFDWTAFDIPNGTAELVGISGTIMGTDGADQAGELINFIFAKDINGVAPPSLGTVNDIVTAELAIKSRNHILGYVNIDREQSDAQLDSMISYNLLGRSFVSTDQAPNPQVMLTGETYSQSNPGFQRIYVAATAESSLNFGTAVLAAGAHSEDDMTITVDDGSAGDSNAAKVFAVGDQLFAADASNSANLVGSVGTVSAVTATVITISGATCPAIGDNQEIGNINPISLKLDLKY